MAEIIGEGFKKIAWHRPTHRRFKFQISSGRSYLSWFEPESDTFKGEMMIDEVKTHPSFNKLTFKGVDKNGKREFMVTFTGLDYQTIQKYIQKMKNTNVNVSQAGGLSTGAATLGITTLIVDTGAAILTILSIGGYGDDDSSGVAGSGSSSSSTN